MFDSQSSATSGTEFREQTSDKVAVNYRQPSSLALNEVVHMFPKYQFEDETSSSYSSQGHSSVPSSFLSIETSQLATDHARRSSFESSGFSNVAELFSGSSAGTTSPSTPFTGTSFGISPNIEEPRIIEPHLDLQAVYALSQDDCDDQEFFLMSALSKEHNNQKVLNPHSIFQPSTIFQDQHNTYYSPSYQTLSNSGYSPAMSQPIFSDSVQTLVGMKPGDDMVHWPSNVAHTPPETIEPRATDIHTLLSSPLVMKSDPSKSTTYYNRSSIILSSSPVSGYSPGVLPSQHEVETSPVFHMSSMPLEKNLVAQDRCRLERRVASRLSRRRYDRKGQSSSSKRRTLSSKSGFDCEPIILQNSFACRYKDCIDKSTGKQKRFKRQEHKKRHEKTVHEKESNGVHQCWVPLCKTRAFTRTDNLKSHLRNTHGKRSANARNRYVATQDPNSECYDPEWAGDLTEDGFPIRN